MNNKVKLILGIGLVGLGGYLCWKKMQNKTNYTGFIFSNRFR